MMGLDAALAKDPFLDGGRVDALGSSYGGYMNNWIAGHTDRFKCLAVHYGDLDERMAYYDTEELWFPEWENGGTPRTATDGFGKHNPIDCVKNGKTPTLGIGTSIFNSSAAEGRGGLVPASHVRASAPAVRGIRGNREPGRRREAERGPGWRVEPRRQDGRGCGGGRGLRL